MKLNKWTIGLVAAGLIGSVSATAMGGQGNNHGRSTAVMQLSDGARSEADMASQFTYKQEGDSLILSGPGFVQTVTGVDHAKLDRIRVSPDGTLALIPYGRDDNGDCLVLIALEKVRKADEKPVLKPTAVVDWRPCDSTVELIDFVPTKSGWSVTFLTGHNRDVRTTFCLNFGPNGESNWTASPARWYGGTFDPSIKLLFGQWVAVHGAAPNGDVDPENYKAFLRKANDSRQ
jgi:hypothetical protein